MHARRCPAAALARRTARLAHVMAQGGRRLALSAAALHMRNLQRPCALSCAHAGLAIHPQDDARSPAVRQDGVRTVHAWGEQVLLLRWVMLLRQVPKEGGCGEGAAARDGGAVRVLVGRRLWRTLLPTRGDGRSLLVDGTLAKLGR
eukprot:5725254-Prymnesium_polylepis.1